MKKTKILTSAMLLVFTLSLFAVLPASAVVTSGKFGNALVFDGEGSYVEVSDTPCLDITQDLTLEAWILVEEYPTYNPTDKYHMYIMSKDSTNGRSYGIGIDLGYYAGKTHYPFFIIFDSTARLAWGDAPITTGVWHHIAGVYEYSTKTLKLYIDGVEAATPVFAASMITAGDANLRIGGREYPGSTCPFKGLIDEVRISNSVRYATAFTPDDSPFTVDENTVGLWHFDEGIGDIAFSDNYDGFCNADGEIYGATWAFPSLVVTIPGIDPEDITISVITAGGLPQCVPPLPDGILTTPYIELLITGTPTGTSTIEFHYVDTGLTIQQERKLRLYMSGHCVDFNCDGTINGQDLTIIQKGIANGETGIETPCGKQLTFDLNNDEQYNDFDLNIVKAFMSKGLVINQIDDPAYHTDRSEARLPWLDITTYVDTDANIIYGETWFFSIFRGR